MTSQMLHCTGPTPSEGRQSLASLVLVLVLALLAPGCGEGEPEAPERFGGLLHGAKARPATVEVDVDRAARSAGELLRAARMPHRRAAALLGTHVARATTSIDVTAGPGAQAPAQAPAGAAAPGDEVERMTVDALIEYESDARFHVLVENSRDYGREVIMADDFLYLRPRYSRFHRRLPTDADEPARIRDDAFAELGAHLELVRAGIEVHDQGPVTHAGRPARRIEIRKAAKPGSPRPEPAAHRTWRETVVVEEAAGEIVLDHETGVPLSGTLRARVTARRDGQPLRMDMTIEQHIESIGGPVSIAPPAVGEWVPTPERSRELDERNALLEDIAQPARAAPTPANPSGGAGEPAGAGERASPGAASGAAGQAP